MPWRCYRKGTTSEVPRRLLGRFLLRFRARRTLQHLEEDCLQGDRPVRGRRPERVSRALPSTAWPPLADGCGDRPGVGGVAPGTPHWGPRKLLDLMLRRHRQWEVPAISLEKTKQHFSGLFETYGLPNRIRTENGSPFASSTLPWLSRRSVWFIMLGICPELIEAGERANSRSWASRAGNRRTGSGRRPGGLVCTGPLTA